jgi:hypothetical protein
MAALESFELDPPFKPVDESGAGVNSNYFNISKSNIQESIVPKSNLKLIKENQDQFDDFTQKK